MLSAHANLSFKLSDPVQLLAKTALRERMLGLCPEIPTVRKPPPYLTQHSYSCSKYLLIKTTFFTIRNCLINEYDHNYHTFTMTNCQFLQHRTHYGTVNASVVPGHTAIVGSKLVVVTSTQRVEDKCIVRPGILQSYFRISHFHSVHAGRQYSQRLADCRKSIHWTCRPGANSNMFVVRGDAGTDAKLCPA